MTDFFVRALLVANMTIMGGTLVAGYAVYRSVMTTAMTVERQVGEAKLVVQEVLAIGQSSARLVELSARDAQDAVRSTAAQAAGQVTEKVEAATAQATALVARLDAASAPLRDKVPGLGGLLGR